MRGDGLKLSNLLLSFRGFVRCSCYSNDQLLFFVLQSRYGGLLALELRRKILISGLGFGKGLALPFLLLPQHCDARSRITQRFRMVRELLLCGFQPALNVLGLRLQEVTLTPQLSACALTF